jgi:O-antigen ligase
VIEKIMTGDLDKVPLSSIGIRIHTWRKAVGWIQERPWTGWGPKSRKALYANSDLPPSIKKQFGHFHNSIIEITLAYGLVGLAVFMLIAGVVGYRAWWAWRRGLMPDDVFFFLGAFFIYWLIVNMFESYVIYTTGYYINALVGGAAYTFYLASRQQQRQA